MTLLNFIYSSSVFVLYFLSTRADFDASSLIRIRLKAIHFENNVANLQKSTIKYEALDEDLQHLIKLMKENPMKSSLDLTFNYEKYFRTNFNPRKMMRMVCKEFQGTRIQPITNTLLLVNDDGDEVDKKNADSGLEYFLYLSSIIKIPVITWFPDRSGQMENYANSMALRLEPMNWHIARAFVDFMQAYNWDLVTIVMSSKQREKNTFLKELRNVQKERSNIENNNHFPFTISDVHTFEGLESDELHNCILQMHRCRTIKTMLVALERIFKNNDRIVIFLGNKVELVALIAAVRKSNGPKRYLKKLLGKGYLWICAPSFMNPIETSERSNSIQLDNIVIQNWISKEGMQVSGMFFLACLNHYSIYRKKTEFVRILWQKSLLKLIQFIKERFPSNSTDLKNKIIPKGICNSNESVWKWGKRLYQIMKSETVEFEDEYIGFHSNGAINTTELFIFNSKTVQGRMRWFKVGKWSMSSKWGKTKSKIRIDGVTWPGGENKPPKGRPDKVKLRVATIQEMPFVFYGKRLENGKCDVNAIPCRILQKAPDESDAGKVYEDDEEEVNYKRPDTISSSNSSGKFPIYVHSCCAGLTMDLLNEMMKDLNFVVDLFEVPDGKWGGWTPQGWNGLVKVLLDGKADLVMTSLKITPNRSEQIDFSAPFMETGIAIIVALRKGAISPTAFLEPYDYPSWCLILVFSVHACGAALFIYEWLSPHGLDRGNIQRADHKFSLVRSLWLIWSMLFGAAVNTDNPRGVASRFLANIWALFALVFLASYTANLAAFMIAKDDFYDLSGIKDWRLMNPHTHKPIFRFATVPSGATEENVKINFPKMFTYMQYFNKTTVDDGIKALKTGEIDAFIYDSNVLDYKAAKDKKCKLKTVGNLYAMTGYGVGFPKGSKWRQKINDLILQYQRYGKLQRAKRFWMTGQCKKQRTLDSTNKRLGVTNFISAFILLLAGMFVCSTILFLEHLFFRYLRLKVRKTDRYGCCQLVSISLSQMMNYEPTVNKSADTLKSSLCSNNTSNSSQSRLKQENEFLKQKIQKLEIALSYMAGCDELHRSNTKHLDIPKDTTDVSISLSNYLTLRERRNRDEAECKEDNNKETTKEPAVLYRCEDQQDISIYCPKHIQLYNQKHSRHHSFYTLPKCQNFDKSQHNCLNAVKDIRKYPSCNNVSSQSKSLKPIQNSSEKYKIIKSISPNNLYRFSNSSFSTFLLKGKRKKDEMLVKESCL